MKIKKTLCGLLSAVMIISCLSAPVLAAEDPVCTHDNKSLDSITWTDDDCTKGGVQPWTCDDCSETGTTNVSPMANHTYTSYDKKCDVCGKVETHTCDADFELSDVTWTDGDCTKGGTITFDCTHCEKHCDNYVVKAQSAHIWGSNDKCVNCSTSKSCAHSDGSLDKIVWKNGDCTQGGIIYYSNCAKCHQNYTETAQARANHTNTEYTNKCDVCGTVTAHVHTGGTADSITWTDGDCTKGGEQTYKYCLKCNEVYTVAVGGNNSHDYDSSDKCTRCGKVQACQHTTKKYIATDNKHHKVICANCSSVISSEESCKFYSYKKLEDDDDKYDKEHRRYCSYCDNHTREDHKLKYEYKSNDKHRAYCEDCDYSERVSCTFENNKCKYCGHLSLNSTSKSYEPTTVQAERSSGLALPKNTLTMAVGGKAIDVVAKTSELRDTANQLMIANVFLTQLGFNQLTPTKTYNLSTYETNASAGQPQNITWINCGLKAGDTAYAVYWNPTKKTNLLPVTVGAQGQATFTVPDFNGAIVTLVKCVKTEKPATSTKKSTTKQTTASSSNVKKTTTTAKEEVDKEANKVSENEVKAADEKSAPTSNSASKSTSTPRPVSTPSTVKQIPTSTR